MSCLGVLEPVLLTPSFSWSAVGGSIWVAGLGIGCHVGSPCCQLAARRPAGGSWGALGA